MGIVGLSALIVFIVVLCRTIKKAKAGKSEEPHLNPSIPGYTSVSMQHPEVLSAAPGEKSAGAAVSRPGLT